MSQKRESTICAECKYHYIQPADPACLTRMDYFCCAGRTKFGWRDHVTGEPLEEHCINRNTTGVCGLFDPSRAKP